MNINITIMDPNVFNNSNMLITWIYDHCGENVFQEIDRYAGICINKIDNIIYILKAAPPWIRRPEFIWNATEPICENIKKIISDWTMQSHVEV